MSMLFCAICFNPRFKENVHCHPVFIIRDINSCRKGYLKDRLKSRESDHFNIKFVILPGGVLPYKRLMGMCRWMGSHFHDWIDYNGVTFLVELLEWGRTFSGFLG